MASCKGVPVDVALKLLQRDLQQSAFSSSTCEQ